MAQTYRTTDLLRWGIGNGSKLTSTEVDRNFWDIIARLIIQEARPDPSAGIDFFVSTGSTFYVHMTDLTVQGPYALPQFDFIDRGDWAPEQTYSVNDVFTENGGLYRVLFAHTSDLTFDAGANDGMGNDFYRLWFQAPGSALPTGGVVGQVITKSSTDEFANNYTWKFPSGGTSRQYLVQQSGTQDDAAWETPQADDIEFTPVTGSELVSDNVADALEELSEALADEIASAGTVSGLSDVLFPTGDPLTSQLLFFDSVTWTTSDIFATNNLVKWDGSTFVGVASSSFATTLLSALTGDVSISSPTSGDMLVWDDVQHSPAKWINRKNYHSYGSTASIVNVGTTANYQTINFTPTASLQIGNGGFSNFGDKTTVIIVTSGTSSYNITPGSGVLMDGTLATGVVSGKVWTLTFVYDPGVSALVETSRTGPM